MKRNSEERRRLKRASMDRKPPQPPPAPPPSVPHPSRPFRTFMFWLIGVIVTLAATAFGVWLTANYAPDLILVVEPETPGSKAIELRKIGKPELKGKYRTEEMEARFRVRNDGLRVGGIERCAVAPLGVHEFPNVQVTDVDRRAIQRGDVKWRTIRFRYDYAATMEVARDIVSWQIDCYDTAGTYVGGIRSAAVLRKGEKPEPPPYDLLRRPRPPD